MGNHVYPTRGDVVAMWLVAMLSVGCTVSAAGAVFIGLVGNRLFVVFLYGPASAVSILLALAAIRYAASWLDSTTEVKFDANIREGLWLIKRMGVFSFWFGVVATFVLTGILLWSQLKKVGL
jgi:hypothetical protein